MKKYKVRSKKGKAKVSRVLGEFKRGKLRSGSKHGPRVKSKAQATAIAISEAKREEQGKRRGRRAARH